MTESEGLSAASVDSLIRVEPCNADRRIVELGPARSAHEFEECMMGDRG